MVEVKLTPSGRGVGSLADRERVSTPAVPERVAPASASRSGPVLRVRCTKDGAGNSVVLFCDGSWRAACTWNRLPCFLIHWDLRGLAADERQTAGPLAVRNRA
jgi:hypothetical protein